MAKREERQQAVVCLLVNQGESGLPLTGAGSTGPLAGPRFDLQTPPEPRPFDPSTYGPLPQTSQNPTGYFLDRYVF